MTQYRSNGDVPFYPFKKLDKPVLSPASGGSWDDEVVANPRILPLKDRFVNFYTGYSQLGTFWGIGIAESEDLMTWRRAVFAPLISTGSKGEWNHANVDGAWPLVLEDGYALLFEGRKLFNTFETQSFGIAFAKGRHDVKWEAYAGNPIFTPTNMTGDFDSIGLLAPVIYRYGKAFFMFYGGYDGEIIQTGLAFSEDLIHWERYQRSPVLGVGAAGAWDSHGVVLINIFQIGGALYGFYEGLDAAGYIRVGLARSDNFFTWQKVGDRPVLEGGKPGSFDEIKVCSPYQMIRDGKIYLFYGAHPKGERPGRTGLAIAKLKNWAGSAMTCFGEIVLP